MTKLKITEFNNIFEADGTSKEEAEIKAMKADLIITIREYLKKHDLTHEEASKIMNVHRCRVSDAVRGQISRFTIDALLSMAIKLGYHYSLKRKKAAA